MRFKHASRTASLVANFAYAMMSRTYLSAFTDPVGGDCVNPAALDRALELAETAVHLDSRRPQLTLSLDMSCFGSASTTRPSRDLSEPSRSTPI